MKHHFELNGTWYRTDAETLNVLRSIIPAAKASGDSSAVIAVMTLGEATGRITLDRQSPKPSTHEG